MQPCPRQTYEATMPSQLEHQSHWREDGTCSYCGSISPDALFNAIEDGRELGPTDKDYKVYVDLVETNPDEMRVIAVANFDMSQREGWVPADPEILARSGWRAGSVEWMKLAKRGPVRHVKFYFQHLSVDERKRFVQLLNDKKINIGYPGYFYRRPFFVAPPPPTQ